MRHTLTIVMIAAILGGTVSLGMAGEPKAPAAADGKKAESTAVKPANAVLRAELHRTLADLIEARSAEKPDVAKVDGLTKKLDELRGRLRSEGAAAVGRGAGWGGAGQGGFGRGYGRGAGWGGAGQGGFGPGYGRGPGWGGAGQGGFGPGYGRGPGWGRAGQGGFGRGFGPGPGWGGGAGQGRGFGPGGGQGKAPGGPAFVDKDEDGVCDHVQSRQGVKK